MDLQFHALPKEDQQRPGVFSLARSGHSTTATHGTRTTQTQPNSQENHHGSTEEEGNEKDDKEDQQKASHKKGRLLMPIYASFKKIRRTGL